MSKILSSVSSSRLGRRMARFIENRRGATAVEFALIAAPFFFLLFSLLEICVVFIMSTVLEFALTEAARGIRTGEHQTNGFSEAQFRQQVCDGMMGLMSCDGAFYLDVQRFDSFTNATNPDPIDASGQMNGGGFGYNPGQPNDIIVVRAFYEWPLFTPVLSAPLANLSNGKHLMGATVAFRNEPFTAPGP